MGNPHLVFFVDERGPALRALAEAEGPRLEVHAAMPNRSNVEFARVEGDLIELVVWERGCGVENRREGRGELSTCFTTATHVRRALRSRAGFHTGSPQVGWRTLIGPA